MISEGRRAVITGMGVLAGNGHDLQTFWESLLEGRSASRHLTRFDAHDMPTRVAAELDGFDASQFVDSTAARRLDLCSLYGLGAAKRALVDAGLAIDALDPSRVGVTLGTSLGALGSTLSSSDGLRTRGYRGAGLAGLLNGHNGAQSAEIAFYLGVRGHAVTIGSGSASSNDANGHALDAIALGRVDVMVAGGAEAPLLPVVWASMCVGRVMTRHAGDPQQAMRPFDRDHDGPLLGEGAAFVVIEELAHARARGARVYCEALAHGRSIEAHHPLAPHPEGLGPHAAMQDGLQRARRHADEIDYINAHGTATVANDVAESRAIQRTVNGRSVPVSSTKPVTGHLLGAAGALETVATALAISRGAVPMTLNFDTPASGCGLDYVRGASRSKKVRVALNLNCGFGGANSCLVLGAI